MEIDTPTSISAIMPMEIDEKPVISPAEIPLANPSENHLPEKCNICSVFLDDNRVKLACNHEYHYICIEKWYQKSLILQSTNCKPRECPYCRKNGGYLTFKTGMTYNKGIHGPTVEELLSQPAQAIPAYLFQGSKSKYSKKPKPAKPAKPAKPIQLPQVVKAQFVKTPCPAMTLKNKQCKYNGYGLYGGFCHIHKNKGATVATTPTVQ